MSFDQGLRMTVVSPRQRKAAELRFKGDVWFLVGLLITSVLVAGCFLVSDTRPLVPTAIVWFSVLITGLQYHVRAVHHEGLADQERRDHLDALRGMH